MTAILIVTGLLVLGVGSVIAADALRRPGDERDPEQPHNPLTRADYEAEAAAPVSEVDEAAAAPLLAYVEEVGTGEFPSLAFDADPLGAPIPDDHHPAEPAFFVEAVAGRFSHQFSAWPAAPALPLSSVQVPDPDPFEAEGFTRGWTREQLAAVLAQAEAKAGASR